MNKIYNLVHVLPEVYQPIFGHPELSERVSRTCEDRLTHIISVHNSLSEFLERPIKVLDLGCAQGYFSLNLALHGAVVQGIDFFDKNIEVCRALAEENPDLNAKFKIDRIENVIENLKIDQYDLVLGLSVFHHLVHEHGVSYVREILNALASKTGILILELALREEPLYWGPSQPEHPTMLLEDLAYVNEVTRHPTHLADIARPFFVVSKKYWVLDGLIDEILSWSEEPHVFSNGVHGATRRYFMGKKYVLKIYKFNIPGSEHNFAEFKNEVKFLNNPLNDFRVPKLALFRENEFGAYVALEKLPGRLLVDILLEGQSVDSRYIILAVLEKLSILEQAGLYHNDVRTWNILVSEDEVNLIDFGSISENKHDCVWPQNIFFSFFIFVKEVVTGVVENPVPLRTIAISPFSLPAPYDLWAEKFWTLPLNQWSFGLMYQELLKIQPVESHEPLTCSTYAWMSAIEEALQVQKIEIRHLKKSEAKASEAEAKASEAEAKASEAVHHLHLVLNSTSWKITAPLRKLMHTLRWFKNGVFAWLLFKPYSRPRRTAKAVLLKLKHFVARSPKLKKLVLTLLKPFPSLSSRLRRVGQANYHSNSQYTMPQTHQDLSPRAKQIYAQLKQAIEQNKKESI